MSRSQSAAKWRIERKKERDYPCRKNDCIFYLGKIQTHNIRSVYPSKDFQMWKNDHRFTYTPKHGRRLISFHILLLHFITVMYTVYDNHLTCVSVGCCNICASFSSSSFIHDRVKITAQTLSSCSFTFTLTYIVFLPVPSTTEPKQRS